MATQLFIFIKYTLQVLIHGYFWTICVLSSLSHRQEEKKNKMNLCRNKHIRSILCLVYEYISATTQYEEWSNVDWIQKWLSGSNIYMTRIMGIR